LRQQGDRKRFAARTVLNDMFHYAYDHGSMKTAVPESFLTGVSGNVFKTGLKQLEREGYIERQGSDWKLTSAGAKTASHQHQNALLWDVYRQYNEVLDLPLIAEDRQQDIYELLPETAVIKLQQKLEENVS